jgi:hypothetical protein
MQDICWYFTFPDEVFVNLQAKFNIIFAHIWKPNPVVTYLTFQYTLNTMCFLSNEILTVALYDDILNILFRISFEKYLLAHTVSVYFKVCDYRSLLALFNISFKYFIKAYGVSGSIAPLILNVDTGWRRVVNFTPRLSSSGTRWK